MGRIAFRLALAAVSMLAAAALIAQPATAIEFVQVAQEDHVTPCPELTEDPPSGGCYVHVEGELLLFFHAFGFEAREAECHVELEARLDDAGNGLITSYSLSEGAHDDCFNGVDELRPCTEDELTTPPFFGFPWIGVAEEQAPGVTQAHFNVCMVPDELGPGILCEGELVFAVTEQPVGSGEQEAQHYAASDLRIGNGWCEVTASLESEATSPHESVHFQHPS